MKSEIMHHLSAAKRGCLSKNELTGAIICILYKPKTVSQRQGLTSRLHDAFSAYRAQHALQTFAQAYISVGVFSAVAHALECRV